MNHTEHIGIQSSERKSSLPTGLRHTEPLENKEEIYQTIVFLPGLDSVDTLAHLVELTHSAPNEPVITDTGQENLWRADDDISFLDDLLAPIALPVQSAHLGELNTPTIGESAVVVFKVIETSKMTDQNECDLPSHFESKAMITEQQMSIPLLPL